MTLRRKRKTTPTLSERLDELVRTAPRGKPWYDSKARRWRRPWVYIRKRDVAAIFMAYRRERAMQAMAALDAEIQREKAHERRRARRKADRAKRRRTTR